VVYLAKFTDKEFKIQLPQFAKISR
jgi:hypothetical protein